MTTPSTRSRTASLARGGSEPSPRVSATGLAALRTLVGLLWLYNVSWKTPPDFGQSSGSGLYGFTSDAVEHPVFPPYSWLVENLVLPNFTAFGWMVLVVETLLAVLLLTGTLVRLAALVGIGQSLAIGLSVAQTPGEWPWAYWMMIGIHVVLLLTASGAVGSVDRLWTAEVDSGPRSALPLLRTWGVVVAASGVVAVVLASGDDPLNSSGAALGGPDLSVSVGTYNLLGAAMLLAVAVAMLAAAQLRRPWPATTGAVLAAIAAGSIYVQVGRTDVWLGASLTSAAFLVCAAVVSGAAAAVLGRPAPDTDPRSVTRG